MDRNVWCGYNRNYIVNIIYKDVVNVLGQSLVNVLGLSLVNVRTTGTWDYRPSQINYS